jgi:hypothetical protein
VRWIGRSASDANSCGFAAIFLTSCSPRDESVRWRTRDCSIHLALLTVRTIQRTGMGSGRTEHFLQNKRVFWIVGAVTILLFPALRHWRYEAISGSDEGILLYLRKTHFIEPKEAISKWNLDALDTLVAPAEEGPRLMSELQNASLSPLRPVERKNQRGKSYVLLTR